MLDNGKQMHGDDEKSTSAELEGAESSATNAPTEEISPRRASKRSRSRRKISAEDQIDKMSGQPNEIETKENTAFLPEIPSQLNTKVEASVTNPPSSARRRSTSHSTGPGSILLRRNKSTKNLTSGAGSNNSRNKRMNNINNSNPRKRTPMRPETKQPSKTLNERVALLQSSDPNRRLVEALAQRLPEVLSTERSVWRVGSIAIKFPPSDLSQSESGLLKAQLTDQELSDLVVSQKEAEAGYWVNETEFPLKQQQAVQVKIIDLSNWFFHKQILNDDARWKHLSCNKLTGKWEARILRLVRETQEHRDAESEKKLQLQKKRAKILGGASPIGRRKRRSSSILSAGSRRGSLTRTLELLASPNDARSPLGSPEVSTPLSVSTNDRGARLSSSKSEANLCPVVNTPSQKLLIFVENTNADGNEGNETGILRPVSPSPLMRGKSYHSVTRRLSRQSIASRSSRGSKHSKSSRGSKLSNGGMGEQRIQGLQNRCPPGIVVQVYFLGTFSTESKAKGAAYKAFMERDTSAVPVPNTETKGKPSPRRVRTVQSSSNRGPTPPRANTSYQSGTGTPKSNAAVLFFESDSSEVPTGHGDIYDMNSPVIKSSMHRSKSSKQVTKENKEVTVNPLDASNTVKDDKTEISLHSQSKSQTTNRSLSPTSTGSRRSQNRAPKSKRNKNEIDQRKTLNISHLQLTVRSTAFAAFSVDQRRLIVLSAIKFALGGDSSTEQLLVKGLTGETRIKHISYIGTNTIRLKLFEYFPITFSVICIVPVNNSKTNIDIRTRNMLRALRPPKSQRRSIAGQSFGSIGGRSFKSVGGHSIASIFNSSCIFGGGESQQHPKVVHTLKMNEILEPLTTADVKSFAVQDLSRLVLDTHGGAVSAVLSPTARHHKLTKSFAKRSEMGRRRRRGVSKHNQDEFPGLRKSAFSHFFHGLALDSQKDVQRQALETESRMKKKNGSRKTKSSKMLGPVQFNSGNNSEDGGGGAEPEEYASIEASGGKVHGRTETPPLHKQNVAANIYEREGHKQKAVSPRGVYVSQRLEFRRAAVTLQRLQRMRQTRMSLALMYRRERGALNIERVLRGLFGRRYATLYRIMVNKAASEIQKFVRSVFARRKALENRLRQSALAFAVQPIIRGWLGRKFVLWKRTTEWAAVNLQRVFRVYRARRIFAAALAQRFFDEVVCPAVRLIQRFYRGHIDRKVYWELRRTEYVSRVLIPAAVRLQAKWRQSRAHKQMSNLLKYAWCAKAIQRNTRRKAAQRKLAKLKHEQLRNTSSTLIAAMVRGKFCRELYMHMQRAHDWTHKVLPSVAKIQARIRRRKAIASMEELRLVACAAPVLQAFWRRVVAKARARQTVEQLAVAYRHRLATHLQSAYRGHRARIDAQVLRRQRLGQHMTAAVAIQRFLRQLKEKWYLERLQQDTQIVQLIHDQDDCQQMRSNIKADLVVVTEELNVRIKVQKKAKQWIKKLKGFRDEMERRLPVVEKEIEGLTEEDVTRGWAEAYETEWDMLTSRIGMSFEEIQGRRIQSSELELEVADLTMEIDDLDMSLDEQVSRACRFSERQNSMQVQFCEKTFEVDRSQRVYEQKCMWAIKDRRASKIKRHFAKTQLDTVREEAGGVMPDDMRMNSCEAQSVNFKTLERFKKRFEVRMAVTRVREMLVRKRDERLKSTANRIVHDTLLDAETQMKQSLRRFTYDLRRPKQDQRSDSTVYCQMCGVPRRVLCACPRDAAAVSKKTMNEDERDDSDIRVELA